MTETQIIEWIRRQFPNRSKNLKVGIGDDCSVVRFGKKECLFTCDALIEGVHFKRSWGNFEAWGKKIAGASLSDIAAMGGKPTLAWIELHLPKNFRMRDVQLFYQGLKKVFRKFGVALAGGNIARSPKGFSATVMVQGERPMGVKMLRSDAKPGDWVYITGPVGWAAMGLEQLKKVPGTLCNKFKKNAFKSPKEAHFHKKVSQGARHLFVKAFLNPQPQIALGQWLAKNRIANACIDVSDGLLKDLDHIAKASGVKIVVEEKKIPHTGPFKKAVTSGEDYILAFTAPASKSKALCKFKEVRQIGIVSKGRPQAFVLGRNNRPLVFRKKGYEAIDL